MSIIGDPKCPIDHSGFYDAVVGVKDAPSQMALRRGLVGRFIDDGPTDPPIKLSRRAKARLRDA